MVVSGLVLWVLAVLAGVLLFRWRCALQQERAEKDWLPLELRHAALVYMERVFSTDAPTPVVARLDRGYRNAAGVIVLVELKTRRRDRTYRSDVIKLSVQRLAVEMQTKETVAPYAYVLIQRARHEQKSSHRAQLLPHAEVVALLKRQDALLAGEEEGWYTQHRAATPHGQVCQDKLLEQRQPQMRGNPLPLLALLYFNHPSGQLFVHGMPLPENNGRLWVTDKFSG